MVLVEYLEEIDCDCGGDCDCGVDVVGEDGFDHHEFDSSDECGNEEDDEDDDEDGMVANKEVRFMATLL